MPAWTQADRKAFEEAARRLHADGWADHVTVEGLLRDWQTLAVEIREYSASVDELTNDLCARDGLERVLKECSSAALHAAVAAADGAYRGATQDDGGAALSRYHRGGSGWWWKRRPVVGPLAKYLDAP